MHNRSPDEPATNQGEVTFFTIPGSSAASFSGGQGNAGRRRDFESGKPWYFLAVAGQERKVPSVPSIAPALYASRGIFRM